MSRTTLNNFSDYGTSLKIGQDIRKLNGCSQTLGEVIYYNPDKCLGVLDLSYHHLPNNLKPCFLSIGDFREDYQV
uniref:Uncharacterized protein n=1 Tax=Solanum lycopersicum TaxID=4081 RepID=A0A3Q7ECC1_SOLLC